MRFCLCSLADQSRFSHLVSDTNYRPIFLHTFETSLTIWPYERTDHASPSKWRYQVTEWLHPWSGHDSRDLQVQGCAAGGADNGHRLPLPRGRGLAIGGRHWRYRRRGGPRAPGQGQCGQTRTKWPMEESVRSLQTSLRQQRR